MESSAKFLPVGEKAKEISASNMGGFVNDYFDGKLQKSVKSAELPADWDALPVKVLVTTNFEAVAKDKARDVFVEFYAPWCGHCKSLAPIWDQIAEKYTDRKDLVMAKVDGAEVEGFPTLIMYKKETNEAVDYTGKRDFESIVKFIETGEQEEAEEEDEPEDEPEDEDEDFGDDEEDDLDEEEDSLPKDEED